MTKASGDGGNVDFQPKTPDSSLYIGEPWTELGNSHRLIYQHGGENRYVHPLKSWFIWNGIFWRRDVDAQIRRRAEATVEDLFNEALLITNDATGQAFRKFALKSQSNSQLRNMVQLAQRSGYVVVSPEALNADPMLLGVLNGTIDLNTGEFREGRQEDYITKQAAVVYDYEAKCPNSIAFQTQIPGRDKDLVSYKQRLFGLLFTGLMVEILFILHGEGANGKTTELETIGGLLGNYAHAADAGVLMSADRTRGGAPTPEIVAVKGKRAVFINETGESEHLNESRVK